MAVNVESVAIVATADGVEFALKVVPGASRSKIVGALGTALKVAVSAPPEGGKANASVIVLLAEALGVKPAAVTIVSGHTRAVKRVAVGGLDVARARERLSEPGPASR
jgi:uncharacterized protein